MTYRSSRSRGTRRKQNKRVRHKQHRAAARAGVDLPRGLRRAMVNGWKSGVSLRKNVVDAD